MKDELNEAAVECVHFSSSPGRHPASIGLTHSWSNHGLWQQQNPPHQSTSTGAPSRIEMRVHYSTPSSPATTPPVGMPPKPPKSDRERRSDARDLPEESVSDRINRRSYYHRFTSTFLRKATNMKVTYRNEAQFSVVHSISVKILPFSFTGSVVSTDR